MESCVPLSVGLASSSVPMPQRRNSLIGAQGKGMAKNSPPNPIAKSNRVLQTQSPQSGQTADVSVGPLGA
jgi:hypothetical protein